LARRERSRFTDGDTSFGAVLCFTDYENLEKSEKLGFLCSPEIEFGKFSRRNFLLTRYEHVSILSESQVKIAHKLEKAGWSNAARKAKN